MGAMTSLITRVSLFTQPFVQAQIKENIKAPRHWPFVRGIHRWPVNSPHKGPVTPKIFPFDDVIMMTSSCVFSFPASGRTAGGLWPVLPLLHHELRLWSSADGSRSRSPRFHQLAGQLARVSMALYDMGTLHTSLALCEGNRRSLRASVEF